MRRMDRKKRGNKSNVGKVVTGALLGSVVGATVGLLMAPTSGQEIRRRLTGDVKSARAKFRTAQGNVESRAREVMSKAKESAGDVKPTVSRRRKVTPTER